MPGRHRAIVRRAVHSGSPRERTRKGEYSMTTTRQRPELTPGSVDTHPGAAAARHRRLPAYDRAALRRPREVHQGSRGSREEREADPSRRPRRMRRMTILQRTRSSPLGTLASVLQLLKLPDGTVKVLVEGVGRARVRNYVRSRGLLRGRGRGPAGSDREQGRGRGAGPLCRARVRELCEAQQEGVARGRCALSARSRTTPSLPIRSRRTSR